MLRLLRQWIRPETFRSRRCATVATAAAVGFWAVWLVGQIARDSAWPTALLFYIPSPVVFLAVVAAASLCPWAKRFRQGAALILLALAPLTVVLFVENRIARRPVSNRPSASLRLVHWNVCGGRLGWDAALSSLRPHNADVYVLSEAPRNTDLDSDCAALGEGYAAVRAGGFSIFIRGAIAGGEWLKQEKPLKAYSLNCRCSGSHLKILVADHASSLRYRRDPGLREIIGLMVSHRADILVGDLNAPRRSRALCPLPRGYVHAYDAAGRGWSYSWPLPFPVCAIDQCIIGSRIAPVSYSLKTRIRSDHRQQILDFAVIE